MDLLEAAILDTITSAPNVSIDLHTNLRQFRTARELIKDGHGNYICGAIELNPAPLPDQVSLSNEIQIDADFHSISISDTSIGTEFGSCGRSSSKTAYASSEFVECQHQGAKQDKIQE